MGERANVLVKSGNEQVCLHSHWDGEDLIDTLRHALRIGKSRWGDFQYLTRIIFCQMIKDDVEGLTGYGISQNVHDANHPSLIVDCDNQTVTIEGKSPVSFSEFVA